MANEEVEKKIKAEKARDAAEAKKNAKMCVYSTADGRAAHVSVAEGEKMLETPDWTDSPANVIREEGGEVKSTEQIVQEAVEKAEKDKQAEIDAAKAEAEAAKKEAAEAKKKEQAAKKEAAAAKKAAEDTK